MGILLKNMLKRAPILILLIFFAFCRPSLAEDTGNSKPASQADSARVIYETRGRIYIDRGMLDGINEAWQVAVPNPYGDSIYLPLSWIGDDISCFNKPDSVYYFFQAGEVLTLHKSQDQKRAGYKITLAYPHIPAMPHEGPVDHYDREFQALVSSSLKIRKLGAKKNLSGGDSSYEDPDSLGDKNNIFDFYADKHQYCDSSSILLKDVFLTLQFYKDHPIPEAYGIKYLPPLNNPLYVYWNTIIDACMPASTVEQKFLAVLESSQLSVLETIQTKTGDDGNDFLMDSLPIIDSQPQGYGNTYGPYFVSEKSKDQIVLLRNSDCRMHGALPDTIIIKIEPDYLKRKLMFQMGEIDFLDLHFSDLDEFTNSHQVKRARLNEVAYLTINNIKPFLSDGIMATALSYLINKDGLCRIALGRSADLRDDLISKWSHEIPQMYRYDKGKGQSLIKNMGPSPKYLSLYISPDDFLNRRTAEYIKGLLERQNIYVTIYSEVQPGEGRSYDMFQQFDMMIGRIDLSLDDPMYILNQAVFHYDLADITRNRSLYYSKDIDSTMNEYLQNPEANENILKNYYRSLAEFPAGLPLFQPIRQVAASSRIRNFELTNEGFIDFSTIEIKDETER